MKKLSFILRSIWLSTAIGIIMLSSSCSDLLDVEAEGTVSGDIYASEADIEKALIGAYYGFGGINDGSVGGELMGGDFILMPTLLARENNTEISWDDVNGPTYSNFMDKNILVANGQVEANWRRAYEVINTLNNILENIDNVSNATAKNRIQGEALAMRGILYFEMIRLWGRQYSATTLDREAIPLKLTPITEVSQISTPELATIEDIYTQAEWDLIDATSLLKDLGKNGTNLSYYTCQGYLMRLNLQKRDFVTANAYADTIITSGEFQLAADPLAAFNNTVNSTEDIFAVQQTAANNAGDRSTGTGLPNFVSSLSESGLGVMRILESSLTLAIRKNGPQYSAADLRGTVDNAADATTTSANINSAFYTNVLNTSTLSSSKYMSADRVIPIIRLAEIHLSRAEAIYEQDINVVDPEALSDLNIVRNRAGLPSLLETDFFNSFAFYDSLVLERKRELIYEGVLFHDLKRWEAKIGNTVATSSKFVLPIPQAETDTWTN